MVPLGTGIGLRQGGVFGLAVDDVDFLDKRVHVVRQVKIVGGRPCFGPPKRGKTRDVPLPGSVGLALAQHIAHNPPVEIVLPWQEPAGKPMTARLILCARDRGALRKTAFQSVDLEAGSLPHRSPTEPRERLPRTAAFLRLNATRCGRDDHRPGRLPRAL